MSKEAVSATKSLQLRHIFGLRSDVNNPFNFLDENHGVFSAGHNIVIHNIEDKIQSFISGSNNSQITAIDIHSPSPSSSSSKKLVAIGEKTEKGGIIQIYEITFKPNNKKMRIRRRKLINIPSDIQSSEIVSLNFSFDGKYLLIVCGAPDWCILNYQKEKNRIVQYIRNQTISSQPFYSASYCISDNNLICCIGHRVLKFYRVEQSELKLCTISLGKREAQDYTSATWDKYDNLNDKRLLISTENGEILIFDGTEYRGSFDVDSNLSIFSISAFSKGFICGCDNGTILYYERINSNDDKEFYKKVNQLSIYQELNQSITHLSISPSEELLTCFLSNNQIYSLNLSQIEVLKQQQHDEDEDEDNCEEDNDNNNNNFSLLFSTLFHYKGINGLDLCVRKPYIVTCGYDRSVKIWNWYSKKMIISQQFREDPLCVAMHPSGLHIVIGFSDKLRLMNILIDNISGYKDFSIKGCVSVKFSHGGQYFAAINASAVQIYSIYTFNNICTLRGHTARVTSLWWTYNDKQLITSSEDNSVLVWNINNNTRSIEHQHKGCSYTSSILDSDNNKLYASGNDNTLKIIDNNGKIENEIELIDNISIQSLDINKNNKNIYLSTDIGMVIIYNIFDNTFKYISAHTSCITRIRLLYDSSMLVTTSTDGSICIFDTNILDTTSDDRDPNMLSWAEEILVSSSDLESRLLEISSLRKKVSDLQLHNEFEIRMKEMNYLSKLQEVNDKFAAELESDKLKYNALRLERDDMLRRYSDTLSSLSSKHSENLNEVENYHQQKIKSELKRYKLLNEKFSKRKNQWNNDIKNKNIKYKNELNDLKKEYSDKIDCIQNEIQNQTSLLLSQKSKFNDIQILLCNDSDFEISSLKKKYDNILKIERTQTLELRGNNGMLKREFAGLQQRIRGGNDKMNKSLCEQNKLIAEIRRFEKDINGLEREISERDSTISEKNKMITEIQKKNQELEKFKFVLDYKIHELDRQIAPREVEITMITKQINEMKNELNKYLKNNNLLELNLKDFKLKLRGFQNEKLRKENILNELKNLIKIIGNQLSNLKKMEIDNDNISELKKGIINMHKQFIDLDLTDLTDTSNESNQNQIELGVGVGGIHREFIRHRNYLERTVQGLQKKLIKDSNVAKKDSKRIIQENVALIREINELRREISVAQNIKQNNNNNNSITNDLKKQIKDNQIEINDLIKLKKKLKDHDDSATIKM